jgi:hypothetical protein
MGSSEAVEHDDRDAGPVIVGRESSAELNPVHWAIEITQPTPSAPGGCQLKGRRRCCNLGAHRSFTIPGRLTSGPAAGALAWNKRRFVSDRP